MFPELCFWNQTKSSERCIFRAYYFVFLQNYFNEIALWQYCYQPALRFIIKSLVQLTTYCNLLAACFWGHCFLQYIFQFYKDPQHKFPIPVNIGTLFTVSPRLLLLLCKSEPNLWVISYHSTEIVTYTLHINLTHGFICMLYCV